MKFQKLFKINRCLKFIKFRFYKNTEQRHLNSCEYLWKKLYSEGHIYLDKYSGWYSVRDEAYFQESELINGKAPTGLTLSGSKSLHIFLICQIGKINY